MLNIDEFYDKHGLSDDSIKLLLEKYHPLTYLPFVSKYITKELYETNTEQVALWLNMIYKDACDVDMSAYDLGKIYKHALLTSDFKFKYTSGLYLNWFNIIEPSDPAELKFNVITSQNVTISDIFKELRGWPGMNNLNFELEDYKIVRNWYPELVKELITNNITNNICLYFVYNMLDHLMKKYKDTKEELTDIKQASLLILGHQCVKSEPYPLLEQIGREIYGNRFDNIYNIGDGLGLLGNKDFWESNRYQITASELPELSFNS